MSRIVVIGGSGGIGSEVVFGYAKRGHSVIVGDRDEKEAEKLVTSHPDNARYIPINVTDSDSRDRFFEELARTGTYINHLVSLAGGALVEEFGGLEATAHEAIDQSIALNLTSHIHLVRDSLAHFAQDEDGSITLVSSINALRDYGLPAYSAAKAGLLGFVYGSTTELGKKGIRINAVLPGTTPTPRTLKEPKDFERLRAGTALGRLTTPKEVANTIYALTHLMTATTGQYVVADCGQVTKV